jgi:imidazoleglycerol phosphate dehydratase HisB
MRAVKVERKTTETDMSIFLNIDGKGDYKIDTGLKFFDHMLSSFARHGSFDIKVSATGDNEHHIVEDVGIALGEAFKKALGDKRGIQRFGFSIIPMDDVLMLASVDLGGRSYCANGVTFRKKKIEDLSSEMIAHFLESFSAELRMNLHTKLLDGKNEHHMAEALFKSLALSLKEACRISGKGIPSTKGVL